MLIQNVDMQKKVIYILFAVINLIYSIVFWVMQYKYKDMKVNILGYKIININDTDTLLNKNMKINLICCLNNSKRINN